MKAGDCHSLVSVGLCQLGQPKKLVEHDQTTHQLQERGWRERYEAYCSESAFVGSLSARMALVLGIENALGVAIRLLDD